MYSLDTDFGNMGGIYDFALKINLPIHLMAWVEGERRMRI